MDQDAAKAQIEARKQEFCKICDRKDFGALVDMFTDDVTMMPDGHPTISGKKQLVESLKKNLPPQQITIMGTFDYFQMVSETSAFGKCVGREVDENGETIRMHNDTMLWKKINGEWYIDRHFFNVKFVAERLCEVSLRDSIKKAVEARLDLILESIDKGDIDTAVSIYEEDAMLVPPMGEPIIGNSAIAQAFSMPSPLKKLVKENVFYFELLDNETVYLNTNVKSVDEKLGTVKGYFRDCQIWKKKKGEWYIHYSMFNASTR